MDNIKGYNEDMQKLISILNTIIESKQYTILLESKDNTLKYGFFDKKMQEVSFNNLNGESFWEFMYKGIYSVEPNSIVTFMNVNSFGNCHSVAIIDLNESVKAIIANRDHKYDDFISKLYELMENSEDLSKEQDGEKNIILKRIKPLSDC